jgi:hypothetical protein
MDAVQPKILLMILQQVGLRCGGVGCKSDLQPVVGGTGKLLSALKWAVLCDSVGRA